jgi:hypothetical protein
MGRVRVSLRRQLLAFDPDSPDYMSVPPVEAIKYWSRKMAREALRKTYLRAFQCRPKTHLTLRLTPRQANKLRKLLRYDLDLVEIGK